MTHGKFSSHDPLSDDESAIDVSELPSEYRVKLNGFLRSACNDGHETLTRVLLDKGADVNYITTNTQLPTALHVAVSNTKERILPILLPQASSATIQAALQYAIQYRSRLATIIKILQQDGSSSETSDSIDKDLDKNSVDSPKKSEAPEQTERETQTHSPAHKENETQTNGGECHDTQTRQQSDPSIPSSPSHQQEAVNESDKPHDIQQVQQQLREQQQQLQSQNDKLSAHQSQHEDAVRRAAQAQQAVEQAQHDLEEMRAKLQKQDAQIENQNKQVQQLNEQLTAQDTQSQKLSSQLSAQEEQTQHLTTQLATHESQTQKLTAEVHEHLGQIEQLQKRIAELEGENKDLSEQFQNERKKSEEVTQEFQNQIVSLQKDIEVKTRSIESVSKERDTERKAKEIAKRMLSSNGPAGDSSDHLTLGHSHAIRMASVMSPTPPGDDDEPRSSSSLSNKPGSLGRSRGAITNGAVSIRTSQDTNDIARKPKIDAAPRVGAKLGSRSRAKDDMDIASEADRARVKRLVERWEELKYLEPKKEKE